MSRTDNTRPYRIQAMDPGVRGEVGHYHVGMTVIDGDSVSCHLAGETVECDFDPNSQRRGRCMRNAHQYGGRRSWNGYAKYYRKVHAKRNRSAAKRRLREMRKDRGYDELPRPYVTRHRALSLCSDLID